MPDAPDPTAPSDSDGPTVQSALPPVGARILAFGSIVIAGLCGGLIGYGVADLQGSGSVGAGIGALIGAVACAGGVAVVAVLVLRAMAEWRVIEHAGDPTAARRAQRDRRL